MILLYEQTPAKALHFIFLPQLLTRPSVVLLFKRARLPGEQRCVGPLHMAQQWQLLSINHWLQPICQLFTHFLGV